MQGCNRLAGYLSFLAMLLLFASCSDSIAPYSSDQSPGHAALPAASSGFDPSACGAIEGRILWKGEIPQVEPFLVYRSFSFIPPWPVSETEKEFPNPNAPLIHANGGVGNAVVFLRNVDVRQARPWHHDPVDVSIRDYEIHVHQGSVTGQTGFVRVGEKVNFVSKEDRFHIIRGRLADFFSLTLPKPHNSRSRTLHKKGLVELSNGAEYYWLRGYLFVDDHPYYARTDTNGRFRLEVVPEGIYELVAWMPNWHRKEHHRNPETRHISRLYFQSPVQQVSSVTIKPGRTTKEQVSFDESMFAN